MLADQDTLRRYWEGDPTAEDRSRPGNPFWVDPPDFSSREPLDHTFNEGTFNHIDDLDYPPGTRMQFSDTESFTEPEWGTSEWAARRDYLYARQRYAHQSIGNHGPYSRFGLWVDFENPEEPYGHYLDGVWATNIGRDDDARRAPAPMVAGILRHRHHQRRAGKYRRAHRSIPGMNMPPPRLPLAPWLIPSQPPSGWFGAGEVLDIALGPPAPPPFDEERDIDIDLTLNGPPRRREWSSSRGGAPHYNPDDEACYDF